MLCPRRLFTMLKDFLHAVRPALHSRHAEQEGKGRLLGPAVMGGGDRLPHPGTLAVSAAAWLVLRLSSWLAGCLAPYRLFGW